MNQQTPWEKFLRARAPHFAVYQAAIEKAEREFHQALAPIGQAHNEAVAKATEEFKKAVDPLYEQYHRDLGNKHSSQNG